MQNHNLDINLQIKQAIQQSNFSIARTLIDQQLAEKLSPTLRFEMLYLDAVLYRLTKDYPSAIHSLNTLLAERPDYGRAYQELGYCHLGIGDNKQAASAFYRATQHNPALLASWQHLLKVYEDKQQQQASDMAGQQISYLRSLPKAVLGAYDLMYEGELIKAEQICRQFLSRQKHQPDAMILLAEIGMQLKVYSDAEFLLESCVELHPDNIRAATHYISLLAKLGQYQQLAQVAGRMMAKYPDNLSYAVSYAEGLMGLGQLDKAISLLKSLVELDGKRAGVWLTLGHALKSNGDIAQGIAAYQKAAEVMPDFGDAYWSLANTKTYGFSEQELSTMQAQEQQADIAINDRIHLLFALGKAHEDRKQFAESFQYYAKGNALKLKISDIDISKTEQAVDAQIKTCDLGLFSHPELGHQAPDPIFIVGLPRAGSTLLEQILASHPLVDGTMELHNILSIAAQLNTQKTAYPFNLAALSADQRQQLGEQYIEKTKVYRGSAPFFIDKMPNNFMHIGLIKLILPRAKIIDARRDPFACCFSGFKQLFGDGQEFTYGLNEIGRYYHAYEKLMAHWENVLPGQILRVQHEDVLDDIEGQVRRLLDYCGLEFDARCLSFYNTKRVIKTPSSEQVRQPLYRSGMDQWRNYQAYLDPLFDALGRHPQT